MTTSLHARLASAPPAVKICCIMTADEAQLALAAGADAIGLVSAMPSGPGVIAEAGIAAIVAGLPAGTASFLLTAHTRADDIIAQHRRCRTTHVQLVDTVAPGELQRLRRALPELGIVPVVHVTGPAAVDAALAAAEHADLLLLDSGNPALAVRELGGTGRTHDWALSRRIRELSPVPVFLAGGLGPDNIARAMDAVGPAGIDLCSSVRRAGRLAAAPLEALFTGIARLRGAGARP